MKKEIFHIILLISIAACTTKHNNQTKQTNLKNEISIQSCEKAIEIAEKLQRGEQIIDLEWEKLFYTKGYNSYLIYSDSIAKKKLIRFALETVFDPSNEKMLDSLLDIPLQMGKDYLKLTLIRNFSDLKNNFGKAKTFLKTTDFNSLIVSGDSLTRNYLPERIQDSLPELYDIHMIMSDPDAKVMDNAIVFDLNMAMNRGKNELIKIVAHEFHHNYRKLIVKSYNHPLMIQLNKIHQEGIADLIDKEEPPISGMSLYPKSVIDAYNSEYKNTPEKLEMLDSITNAFLRHEIDTGTYFSQLKNFFGFGGHTAGLYMTSAIVKKQNIESLIESFDDPVEFISIYNLVAQESSNEHVFSAEFINFIKQLDKQASTSQIPN